jgi:hypothetical protein
VAALVSTDQELTSAVTNSLRILPRKKAKKSELLKASQINPFNSLAVGKPYGQLVIRGVIKRALPLSVRAP